MPAAATMRTGSSAVSTSSTSSAPFSITQSAPAKPRSREPEMQHLDNVLRLEDLGLEAVERDGGPVAAPVEGQADAGVGHEAHDALLHPPLGQGEMDDGVAGRIGGGQEGSRPRGGSGPRPWQNGRFL